MKKYRVTLNNCNDLVIFVDANDMQDAKDKLYDYLEISSTFIKIEEVII